MVGYKCLLPFVFLSGLPACQSMNGLPGKIDPNPNPNSIRDAGELPSQSDESTSEDDTTRKNEPIAVPAEELYYGDQVFFRPSELTETSSAAKIDPAFGESFSFRDAPIELVLNQILGETFGLSYSVDPQVSGSLTLRLEGIVTREQAIAGLDAALNVQGIQITESDGTLIISRIGSRERDATLPVFISAEDALPADAPLAVLQIQYANIADVTEIAKSMLPSGIIQYADDARGVVVLSGEPNDVSAAVKLLRSLDVNWLSSVSTALIPIENASPSEIAADIQPILQRIGGVSVVPLDRLQTLMVISRHPETLDQARQWISRLDQDATPKLTRDLLIYEARHVNAEDLIALTGGGPQQPTNQVLSYPVAPISPLPGIGGQYPPSQTPRQNEGLYSNLTIVIDPGQNSVIARGPSDELQSLSDLLSALDQPKRQVLIEATIVEVTLADGDSLGVQWDAIEDNLAVAFSDSPTGAVTSLFPGVSASYVNTDITAVINALSTTSDVEIVSSPRMLVLNNETARLQIGDQVPVITQSAVSITDPGAPVVNSTTYRDTGVILTVTPRVRAGGMVEIEVEQEVSGVSETTTSNIDSPTISQRSLESILAVPDGSTAVLGGLMSSTRSYSQTGIPILKDTPVLGAAFRSTSQTERRTELVILIEPTVVLSVDPITDIPESLRNALLRVKDVPLS